MIDGETDNGEADAGDADHQDRPATKGRSGQDDDNDVEHRNRDIEPHEDVCHQDRAGQTDRDGWRRPSGAAALLQPGGAPFAHPPGATR
jgi:hypothetical protein